MTTTRSLMFLHHGQVVGDEDHRQAVAGLHVLEQVEDLGLHGHVEGRHRLVADEQLRVERPGPGRCRSAGTGRRRTRGAAGRRAVAGRGRRPPASRRPWPRRLVRRPVRGSPAPPPTMSRTRRRGLSDEIGSWKIIWSRRARLRSSARRQLGELGPSNRTEPTVGGGSWMMARPVVDLPQPDSPTRPSVSPRPTSKRHAGHGVDLAGRAGRELDDQVLDRAAAAPAAGRQVGRRRCRASQRCRPGMAADVGLVAAAGAGLGAGRPDSSRRTGGRASRSTSGGSASVHRARA